MYFSVKCGEKSVKTAYFTICAACSARDKVCGKCGQKGDLVERYYGCYTKFSNLCINTLNSFTV